ncbi:MAG: hypothetical protein LBK83_04990 [Treponema sp.]|jgi:predicted small secreted protein|nr:hypothetical protein [Treponema sp.]
MKKNTFFMTGILVILLVFGLVLAGCNNSSGGGGGGGCPNPNGTCWYKSDSDKSFCSETSCGLAYDYNASCQCGK